MGRLDEIIDYFLTENNKGSSSSKKPHVPVGEKHSDDPNKGGEIKIDNETMLLLAQTNPKGTLHGLTQFLLKKSNNLTKITFDNGVIVKLVALKDDVATMTIDFCEGKIHGKMTQSFPSGRPKSVQSFCKGVLHGESQTFDEKGNVILNIKYKDGKLIE